jgi:hypothetical protein
MECFRFFDEWRLVRHPICQVFPRESSGADPAGTRAAIPAGADSAAEIKKISRLNKKTEQLSIFRLPNDYRTKER